MVTAKVKNIVGEVAFERLSLSVIAVVCAAFFAGMSLQVRLEKSNRLHASRGRLLRSMSFFSCFFEQGSDISSLQLLAVHSLSFTPKTLKHGCVLTWPVE